MRLTRRLDALERRLPPRRTGWDDEAVDRQICEMLEKYAPIPAGEEYADFDVRLDAALDRLHAAGVGISAGPLRSRMERIAAVYGMNLREFDEALRERASRCRARHTPLGICAPK